MDLREVTDRVAINELIARYCHALDLQDWPAFHALFTDDAVLDYTQFGGPKGSPGTLQAFLSPVLEGLANAQHLAAAVMIDFSDDGESAQARSTAIVPLTSRTADGGEQTAFSGLRYEDEMQRTPAGWRIASRRLVRGWTMTPKVESA